MSVFAPIDIEDVLRSELTSETLSVYAPPIPNPLPVPSARVRRTGGVKNSLVVDGSNVVIDVWAETDAEAMAYANKLLGDLYMMQFTHDKIHQVVTVSLPYQNNDPQHPDLCRAAFMVQVFATSERS